MRILRTISRLILLLTLAVVPTLASASGADIRDIAYGLITTFKGTWMIVATLVIVIAGFTLMLSHDEGQLQKANKTIIGVVIGGVIITLMLLLGGNYATLISFFYNGTASFNVLSGLPAVQLQTEGVASWLMSMAVVGAVVMIIVGMLEAVFSFGADEGAYTKIRTAILHIILALLVMIAAKIIREVFFVIHEPSPLMAFMLGKLLIVLGIITLIAVAILIYAGVRMITSFGREDDFTAAKSLLIRVITGLIVIAISFSLVWIVTTVFD